MPENPIRLRTLDHVVLRVRDMPTMLRFYCDVLGCVHEREAEAMGLVQLRAGASLIDLVDAAGKLGAKGGAAPGDEGHNVDHFCLRIEGFDEVALRNWLQGHGVEPGESGSRYGAEGQGPSLYLADPEGNTVELKGPPWPEGRAP